MTSEDNSKRGTVYVLWNPSMPKHIKIGRTQGTSPDSVLKRIKQLSRTSVPMDFRCAYAAVVDDAREVEKGLHAVFEGYRTNPKREFFTNLPVPNAIAALKLTRGLEVTPTGDEEKQEEPVKAAKKPRFSFKMLDIPQGAKLKLFNDADKTCTVVDDRNVEYEGKITALSPLTRDLLGWSHTPAGPDYWVYENETLNDRRKRLESEDSG